VKSLVFDPDKALPALAALSGVLKERMSLIVSGMTSLTNRHGLNSAAIIPFVATIARLVPFVGKAFHMDDPLFVWSAGLRQRFYSYWALLWARK